MQRAGDDVLRGKFVVGGHNGHLQFGHDQHHRLHVLAVDEVFGSHQRLLQHLTQVPGQQTAVLVRGLVLQVLVVLQLLRLGLQLVLHPEQTVLDLLHQRLQRLVPREFRVVPLELLQVLLERAVAVPGFHLYYKLNTLNGVCAASSSMSWYCRSIFFKRDSTCTLFSTIPPSL